jgi:hypothetical protein
MEQALECHWSVVYLMNGSFGNAPLATPEPLVTEQDLLSVREQLASGYNSNHEKKITVENVVIFSVLALPVLHSSLFVKMEDEVPAPIEVSE